MSEPTVTEEVLTPFMPDNDLDRWFWIGAVQATLQRPDMMASFRQETGCHWNPGRTPIERMIDKGTGADRHFFETFLSWFNAQVWGMADGKVLSPLTHSRPQ